MPIPTSIATAPGSGVEGVGGVLKVNEPLIAPPALVWLKLPSNSADCPAEVTAPVVEVTVPNSPKLAKEPEPFVVPRKLMVVLGVKV